MSECKSCSAPIRWAWTERLTTMPIDVEPVADGNIRLEKRGARWYAVVDNNIEEGQLRYVSHYVTCPQAKQWRKK